MSEEFFDYIQADNKKQEYPKPDPNIEYVSIKEIAKLVGKSAITVRRKLAYSMIRHNDDQDRVVVTKVDTVRGEAYVIDKNFASQYFSEGGLGGVGGVGDSVIRVSDTVTDRVGESRVDSVDDIVVILKTQLEKEEDKNTHLQKRIDHLTDELSNNQKELLRQNDQYQRLLAQHNDNLKLITSSKEEEPRVVKTEEEKTSGIWMWISLIIILSGAALAVWLLYFK